MDSPGYKTTEFWFAVAAFIFGALLASGAIVEGSIWYTIVGGVVSILAGLGYTWSRAKVKTGE